MTLLPNDKPEDTKLVDVARYVAILSIILLTIYICREIKGWMGRSVRLEDEGGRNGKKN